MNVLDLFVSQPMVLRLGWTLFHFVWQATLVALIVAIILQCINKQAASIRYAIASLSLVFIVVMGVITFTQVSVSRRLPKSVYQPALSLVQAEKPSQTVKSTEIQPTSANTEPTFSWPVFRKRCISLAEPALPYAVIGWLVGVLTLSLMHMGGWTRLRRIRQEVTRPISPELEQTAQDIAHRLGVHKAFKVLESGLVQVPTAIGHMKPVILLPASALTGLSFEQIEIILAHELAHIKRHDYLINLFQTAIETLGFYHPAIWWLSHIIRLERENCCDDRVVQAFSNPVQYAKALANLAKIRSRQIDLAMAANGSILVHRIERLLSMDRQEHRRPTWLASILCLVLIMAIAIQTTVAFAAKDRRQRPASDDVAATFNEWVNAIVDNDTKAFEIIAHKMTMHRGAGPNQAAIAERFQGRGQELIEAFDGFDRLKIVSMENKGDHFDVLTSPVKDPQGVSGRLSIDISTKAKPFYVSGVVRFITTTGTSYSVPQQVLTRIYYLIAPNNFPLIERLPDSSGHISPNALTTFREAIKTLSNVKVFASPQVINLSGSLSTMKIEGNENNTFETSVLSKVRGDRTTIVMDFEYDVLYEGESIHGQDQATMPSEYAIYTKAHTFSEKSAALYILIQSTTLKSPQRETEPFQVSSRTIELNRDKSGKVASEDGDRRARKAAGEKLTNQELLAKAAIEAQDAYVGKDAVEKLTDQALLAKVAIEGELFNIRTAAVKKLVDQEVLGKIAIEDEVVNVRNAAVKKLTDLTLLAKSAVEDEHWVVRKAAITRLANQALPVNSPPETQIEIARMLGEMGNPWAIVHLQSLADTWGGEFQENPFLAEIRAKGTGTWLFDVPPIVARLRDRGAPRYVRVAFWLEMNGRFDPAVGAAYKTDYLEKIKRWISIYHSSLTSSELQDEKNLQQVLAQVKNGLNEMLSSDGSPLIVNVQFSERAIQ